MFSATTPEEWNVLYISKSARKVPGYRAVAEKEVQIGGPVIDWQAEGAVSKVIAQGQCLAMYAFAAVGAAEGLAAIYFRAPAQLSTQQVLDCSATYGNRGCDNGTVPAAFDFIVGRGLMTANDYPYNGGPMPCRFQSGTFRGVKSYSNIVGCNDLALALAKQPVAVAIDGTYIMYYQGGLFGQCDFDPNYPMLLTGMTDTYWRLKGPIGTVWGEMGYIRIVRGNSCGVCMAGILPSP